MTAPNSTEPRKLRSRAWFDDPSNADMTALYLERYMNFGLTLQELQSGKPVIGIAQTGSDLSPCNRHHIVLAQRLREGIREAGGIAIEFPVHPIQETGKRPTAGLDRNLAYLGLVEILFGYPLDGVVLTIGCDKTTPACLMAAATVNIPAIALSVGPMLNGWYRGERTGSGTIVWKAREMMAKGEIDYPQFIDLVASSAPSTGYCNTMGTASTMNSLAEALGMQLPGSAAIPAPYRDRQEMAYRTGLRIVDMVHEDLKPSDILTKDNFVNAIVVNSAIGGSTNAPIHIVAIAKHIGVDLKVEDFETHGHKVPLLVNLQPAGEYLGEDYYHAGGVPAVVNELMKHGLIRENAPTANGRTIGENCRNTPIQDEKVIRPFGQPLKEHIDGLWRVLTREPRKHPPNGSLLPLPSPYVVPGGRFREIYYWDSYFTMLGLAESGRHDLLRAMADNFAWLIEHYGHVPNGNRSYYLSRSQPPVFALMVGLFEQRGLCAAVKYLPQLRREYAWWMEGTDALRPGEAHRHAVRLEDGNLSFEQLLEQVKAYRQNH